MSRDLYKVLTFTGILVFMTGCASSINYLEADPAAVEQAVQVHSSEFDRAIKYEGPQIRKNVNRGLSTYDYERYALVAGIDTESGQKVYGLGAYINYRFEWRYYYLASFQNKEQKSLNVLNRKVDFCGEYSCYYIEEFGIPLDENFLREHQDNGFTVRVSSKSGHENFLVVPASYIQGFMKAINQ